MEGTSREIHPIVRDDVFRIAAEALRNAFLYAEASRIEVEIHCDERQLRLRIRDDGRGIDSQIVTDQGCNGHWGLQGMHERARLVGGKLEVWSRLDCGTEIELTFPPPSLTPGRPLDDVPGCKEGDRREVTRRVIDLIFFADDPYLVVSRVVWITNIDWSRWRHEKGENPKR